MMMRFSPLDEIIKIRDRQPPELPAGGLVPPRRASGSDCFVPEDLQALAMTIIYKNPGSAIHGRKLLVLTSKKIYLRKSALICG